MGARIGILGGTFDPIHIGHLIVGQEALWRCSLDQMLFVPCADPPHKRSSQMAPAEVRAEMVRLAISDNPFFALSRIELDRPGTSYTVDTLRILRERLGDSAQVFLVIGADGAVEMRTWCNPEGVLELAQVTVVGRPGFDLRQVDPELGRQMTFLEIPLVDVSSTDIRRRLRAGDPVRYLLPDAVAQFIQSGGLYR